MNTVYIFGIGSPFGDDSIGWTTIDELENELVPSENIVIEKLKSPGSIFRFEFTQSDFLIFIDAMMTDEKADTKTGTIHTYNANQLPASSKHVSSHGFNLKTSLDLLLGLGLSYKQIMVIGIEMPMISQIDYIQDITHAFRTTTKHVASRVLSLLDDFQLEYKC